MPANNLARTTRTGVNRAAKLSLSGSGLSRREVGEVEDLCIRNRRHDIGHRGIVSRARIGFVLPQALDQVVLSLACQARNVVAPRQIRVVTEVAAIAPHEVLAAIDAGGVAGLALRRGRGKLGDV